MKKLISKIFATAVAMVALTFGSGCNAQVQPGAVTVSPTVVSPTGTVQNMDPSAAAKLIATNKALQVLDVRTPEEVAGGVIAGAKALNWFDGDFAERVQGMLDKSKPVLVYCKAGGRSSQAANVLIGKGYKNVYNLTGGITRWTSEGHPTEALK